MIRIWKVHALNFPVSLSKVLNLTVHFKPTGQYIYRILFVILSNKQLLVIWTNTMKLMLIAIKSNVNWCPSEGHCLSHAISRDYLTKCVICTMRMYVEQGVKWSFLRLSGTALCAVARVSCHSPRFPLLALPTRPSVVLLLISLCLSHSTPAFFASWPRFRRPTSQNWAKFYQS